MGFAVESKGPDEPRVDREAWWMVTVLVLLFILSFVDRMMIVLLVEPIKADLDLTDFEMSLVMGPAFGICFTLLCVPSGWAADRLSRRWVIACGVLLWASMTMLSGFASSFATLFVARALVAVGEVALTPAAYSLILDRFPGARVASAIAAYNMGPKLGQSVAYLLGVVALAAATLIAGTHLPVVGSLQPWQIVLILAGAPGIVMALLPFTFREPPRRHAPDRKRDEAGPTVVSYLWARRKVFVPFLLGFCLVTMAAGAITTWTPSHMARAFGWSPTAYGSALGAVNIIGALTLIPTGMFLDRLYARGMRDAAVRFYSWILAVAAPASVAIFLLGNPIHFLIGFGFLAVIVLPYMIYVASTLSVIVPSALRGRVTGLLIMLFSLFGTTLGPTAVAGLTDFVFRDPSKLGHSMAIVVAGGLAGALVLLRYVLGALQPMLPEAPEPRAEVAAGLPG